MLTFLLALHESRQGGAWRDALSGQGRWAVQGPAHSLSEAGRLAAAQVPALLVGDLRLRDGSLIDLLRQLRSGRKGPMLPVLPVLALVDDPADPLLLDLLQAGANSFFMTATARPGALVDQALGVLAGEAHVPAPMAQCLLDHFKARGTGYAQSTLEELSNPLSLDDAEWALLCQLAVGERLSDLARRAGQAPHQLMTRLRGICRKMQWDQRAGNLQLA